jgi:uncharacterized protein
MLTKKKVILAGGSGFLGQALAQSLLSDHVEVVILSRKISSAPIHGRVVLWDGRTIGNWSNELNGAYALFNLTGRSVDCRYTEKNRELIMNSRVDSTRVLGEAVSQCSEVPRVWLNSSTATIYKDRRGDLAPHDESSEDWGSGFSVEVGRAWEKAFSDFRTEETRQIILRVSIVLGREGGAFPVMRRFASLGLGGAQGPGSQWMSWLHLDDWVGIAKFLMEKDELSGTVNLAAPHPVTNSDFMKGMRKCFAPLGIGFPAPTPAVRLGAVFMRTAPELVLKSRKVISAVLDKNGYQFKHSTLASALDDLSR